MHQFRSFSAFGNGASNICARKEIERDPKAQAAIEEGGFKLRQQNVWDDTASEVWEYSDLIQWSNENKINIICGELLPLGGIKNHEMGEAFWKYKGRVCFRAHIAKDGYGLPAVYLELSARPAGIHSVNVNLSYGLLPGNKTTQADAVQAYIQSWLKTHVPTFVIVPWALQTPSWRGKFKKPEWPWGE